MADGGPAQPRPRQEGADRALPSARVRLMSWNIHGGRGPDGTDRLGAAIARIAAAQPDIAAIQEIDSRGFGAGDGSPFVRIAAAVGEHRAEAFTILAPDGGYGHMLASRWPVDALRLHDLSFGAREPRMAIEARVATPFGPLAVVAVHLGLEWGERRAQAAILGALARRLPQPAVMLGDFNDWFPFAAVRSTLARAFPGRSRVSTFPASLPLLRLDRIYARPAAALRRSWSDPAARHDSDHLPVLAELELGDVRAALREGPGAAASEMREVAVADGERPAVAAEHRDG